MNRFRFTKVRDVKSPTRGNDGDAGLDFYVPNDILESDQYVHLCDVNPHIGMCIPTIEGEIRLDAGQRILIPSGIKPLIEPKDSMLMAANKSGLSSKNGILYTSEIVDSPYTGEIHIGIINTGDIPFMIKPGMKLTQFIHVPVYLTEPEEITNMDFYMESQMWGSRGENGFGSTGE